MKVEEGRDGAKKKQKEAQGPFLMGFTASAKQSETFDQKL
jgi:hypothetical protein